MTAAEQTLPPQYNFNPQSPTNPLQPKERFMIPIDLTGKLAVITGASGQLGRVMARTLA